MIGNFRVNGRKIKKWKRMKKLKWEKEKSGVNKEKKEKRNNFYSCVYTSVTFFSISIVMGGNKENDFFSSDW